MAAGAIMALLPIQAQKKFVFTPQWTAQAQFAGYYVAKEIENKLNKKNSISSGYNDFVIKPPSYAGRTVSNE